ncbi:MAG TPA: hypothetical protein VMU95_07425 [Trebonia sp.]|nr:hypothetical protein [Trebonia sp.]
MKSWLARTLRGRRLDRNPLRRRSDRAETLATIVLVAAFAIAAPFTVHATAAGAYSLAKQARSAALAARQEVTAVTLEAAPAHALTRTAAARWTAPDGRARTGQVQVNDTAAKGTAERIWVTWSGDVAAPPLSASESAQLADLTALGAGLGLAVFFLLACLAMRRAFDRRRLATWEAEWAAVEPWWNRQRW